MESKSFEKLEKQGDPVRDRQTVSLVRIRISLLIFKYTLPYLQPIRGSHFMSTSLILKRSIWWN
jgi:hypothetical protein